MLWLKLVGEGIKWRWTYTDKITNYRSKITWTGNADYKNIDPKMQLDETTNIIASFN
ncbi:MULTISPECIES: hypothetical protein [unclassified Pedobacter]|uniref:hypothetical protein n=1 Tax=unclassified Pedobacter TaxID=2628915 RepID=UPI001424237A|nr:MULTISPECIES: hypothetical protein [unclassified Pedobacter]NII81163.1 hypothetical protein [Pedobacter sp. SG908]NMN35180.1 hypothetical protein [Pedobacter sp. SG918]